MGRPMNDDPFQPWNDPVFQDDPDAAHNHPMYGDDPFKPWNDPFGKAEDLTDEEALTYGIRRSSEEEEYQPEDSEWLFFLFV